MDKRQQQEEFRALLNDYSLIVHDLFIIVSLFNIIFNLSFNQFSPLVINDQRKLV